METEGHGTLAQQAYEAYGDAVGWMAHTGKPMPAWIDLPDATKAGWSAAVVKIASVIT